MCVCSRLLHSGTERAVNATCSPISLSVSLYSSYSNPILQKAGPLLIWDRLVLHISMLTTVEESRVDSGGHFGSRAWVSRVLPRVTRTFVLSAVETERLLSRLWKRLVIMSSLILKRWFVNEENVHLVYVSIAKIIFEWLRERQMF